MEILSDLPKVTQLIKRQPQIKTRSIKFGWSASRYSNGYLSQHDPEQAGMLPDHGWEGLEPSYKAVLGYLGSQTSVSSAGFLDWQDSQAAAGRGWSQVLGPFQNLWKHR